MTMITPSYLGETIEYSSLHACRSTLEDPTLPGRGMTFLTLVTTIRPSRSSSEQTLMLFRQIPVAGPQ